MTLCIYPKRNQKARTANSTYPKGGASCSKDSFVVNQTLVFQIKFCGKSPAHLKAANVSGKHMCQAIPLEFKFIFQLAILMLYLH